MVSATTVIHTANRDLSLTARTAAGGGDRCRFVVENGACVAIEVSLMGTTVRFERG